MNNYPLLKKFARFILDQHLDALVNDSIQKAREENLPILKQLSHLTEVQIFEISKRGFAEDNLIPITEGNYFYKVLESIRNWKANALVIPKDKINIIDITGIYYIRRVALIRMLRHYNYSKEEGIALLEEIENYFTVCANLACEAYEEIHKGALQESQQLLNGILCNIPVIISRVDKEGNMLQSMGCGLESLGMKDGQLVGTNIFKMHPNAENTARAIKGEKVSFQGSIKDKNGKERYYQSYFFPEENGALGFSIDITDLKVAQEKLNEREYFIKKVADATPIIIQVYDHINSVDLYSNMELGEMLGYSSEQVTAMGKSLAQKVVHPEDLPRLLERGKKIDEAADGQIIESEMRVKDATGTYHWIFTRSTVFKRTADGKVWQTLSTSIDTTEKKNAEEKLQQQLRVFDIALSNTLDFNYIFDLEGRFTYVNKPLLDLWGKTKEEAFGKNFKELGYPDELVKLHDSQLREVIQSKHTVRGENSYMNPEGNLGYYQYTFVPVFGTTGDVEAIVGTTHDITQLKLAAEKKYRSIFESTNDAILIFNFDGYLAEANPAACAMHGYSYKEMIDMPGIDFVHPDDHAKFFEFIQQVKEGKGYHAECKHIRKDGSIVLIDKTGSGFDFKGTPHILAILRDITERKNAEEALKESEDRFRSMADNIPNLAWIADASGWIFWYNKRWYEFSGTTPEQMEGWGWQSIHDPKELPRVMEGWTKAIQTGEAFEMVFPLRRADNIFCNFLTRVNPVRDEEGKIVRWFGTNTDITEQIKAEEALEKKNKELLKINNDLDNFIYTASHDLKAPVSNIEGLIHALYESLQGSNKIDKDIDSFMGMINISVQRFQATIKDLTEISKIQKQIYEEMEDINVPEIFEEVRSSIETQIKESGAIITTNFTCLTIRFSKINFRSIVHNLLTNAIKYRSPDRTPLINVSCQEENDWYIFMVTDNGLGIHEKQKAKMFGMFKRLHDHVEGSGVGLYLVKRIVDNAEGNIEVESEPGKGSTFKIYIKK